jgi:hypothetical protein
MRQDSLEDLKLDHCVNHPDRETGYECLKHQIYMCQDCLDCRDPEIYCKFRESCTIWFLTKKNFDDDAIEKNRIYPG